MHLTYLHLINFKNYAEVAVEFPSKINVLVGLNGSGKTNLLDAIHYLSLTKSAFQADQYMIRQGEKHFFLRGLFELNKKKHEVTAGLQVGSRKVLKEDGAEYQKISDHIGKYPVVMITPDDVSLIREGSEVRRRFFDAIISQVDRPYLENLIQYNHALRQRNSLLGMFNQSGKTDWVALEAYDAMLIARGVPIFEARESFVTKYLPLFQRHYNFLADQSELASIQYVSGLEKTNYAAGLVKTRAQDMALQRTTFGIHRDDFGFTLAQRDLRRMGSQGQQKSFVIALKLAQWEIVNDRKGFKPIILLDDIFDKLDDTRITRLLELIKHSFGQLFVTDARPDRTRELLKNDQSVTAFFDVRDGIIRPAL